MKKKQKVSKLFQERVNERKLCIISNEEYHRKRCKSKRTTPLGSLYAS